MSDLINKPPHYNQHPRGIQCVEVTEFMSMNIGTAVAYLWRVDFKGSGDEDIEKAIWFLQRELGRRKFARENNVVLRPGYKQGETQGDK